KGSYVGYVIIGLGVVALLLGSFKVIEISSFKTASVKDVQDTLDLLAEGKTEEAEARANQVKGVAGEMLARGAEHSKEKRGVIEELMYERILKCRPNLERFLPFIALIAAAAPLLGLLGTVIGMIRTFNLITIFGTGDAQSLSKGISEALVTTELGLIVAIPALLLHGGLSRFAKRKLAQLEQAAVAFLNGLSLIK
ncbi:MAG: MotA/TolQ/ExbB proton channel family protein, partial [Puniceicoccales bacterium]